MSGLPDLKLRPGAVIQHTTDGAYRIVRVQQTWRYRLCSFLFKLFDSGKRRWE